MLRAKRIKKFYSTIELQARPSLLANRRLTRRRSTSGTAVMAYGTFDLLHPGHIRLLQRARATGDHLTVGLSTDEFNRQKHKTAVYSYEARKMMLESLSCVDKVVPERSWDQKVHDIYRHGIDIIVMGDDWEGDPHFEGLRSHCHVHYFPYTKDISTSDLKKQLAFDDAQRMF